MRTAASQAEFPRGTVADVLETKGSTVYAVSPRDTVFDAVLKMNDCEVGALPVMAGAQLVGILSERDCTRKVVLLGRAARDTRVEEVMSAPVIRVGTRTGLHECMQIMTHRRIRHLPVVEAERVVGIVSIGDLVRTVVAQQADTIASLNSYIGSEYPA